MKNVTKIKTLYRWSKVAGTIVSFFIESAMIGQSRGETLKQRALLSQKYARKLLTILNVETRRNFSGELIQSGLVVSNHISYLDILVISAELPALFVTSVEVRNSGWAGKLCELAGCLFVERRSRENRDSEIRQIEIVLQMGIPVVVFPEATSSSGTSVLPFKSTLFECAIRAQVPVHNFLVRYENEEVPYYADMTLVDHLFRLTAVKKIEAELEFLESFPVSEKTQRKALAEASERLIRECYVAGA
jgi:1-acyl-sn-glycerol-3-phosphate acyltransferase